MKLIFKILIPIFLILGTAFYFGPKPSYTPVIQSFKNTHVSEIKDLNKYVTGIESLYGEIKPDNQARIVWADSTQQTEYSIVYLHGFSASQGEGAPLHTEFAKRYGCNLYLPRLSAHGLTDKDAFLKLTPQSLVESAKDAIEVGKKIGKKVILMSCSTGSTLAIYLSSNNPNVYAHFMYSPNIDLYDPKSNVLLYPWSKKIAEMVEGGDYHKWEMPKKAEQYWYKEYRIEGLIALKYLIKETMTDDVFKGVNQPTFLGYYYKNEAECDKTVSVSRMKEFFEKSTTPSSQKLMVAFPEAGTHIITSPLFSKQYEDTKLKSYEFAESVLGMKPVL